MKKIIFILGLAAVVLGTSCSDVLDLNPADRFSPATVWSTTTTADKYVIGLYSIFGANTEMRGGDAYASPRLSDAYSDILKSTSWNQYDAQLQRHAPPGNGFQQQLRRCVRVLVESL